MVGTFGAWIDGQKQRQDQIGEIARYWADLKGNQRIRALPSVENKLREAGALEEGAPTRAWWDAAVAEYRALKNQPTTMSGRPLSGPVGVVPDPAAGMQLTGDGPADLDAVYRQATGQEPPPYESPQDRILSVLESHTRFLAAIAVRLGLSATAVAELAAAAGVQPQPMVQPVPWAGLFGSVDWDAVEGGGGAQ
jgi:hypothetical protein